ncbi:hypothetical protein O7553_00800 [Solwaraspora sp. WMMA2059]|uniref:hypothetical protein n=1 Tax=Solwaraspora sp. WMMA2059 TaxID=3015160 RepID=UPI00248B1521|nr:hypothetical protein [Solwaraspora sp. WMMA2059]WBB97566.1 hypothetical protein O7553_00800 [Solwaraspora sp. WMMA2059]
MTDDPPATPAVPPAHPAAAAPPPSSSGPSSAEVPSSAAMPPSAAGQGPVRRWWRWSLAAAAVAWSVLLFGLAVQSQRDDSPTVREQRDIGQARPVADRAAIDLTAAVGDAGVVVLAEEQISAGCRITPMRPGAELTRVLTVYTAPDSGPALLDRIAHRLPASYAAIARHDAATGRSRLGADAGDFVAVRGELIRAGVVQLRISTGCRPASDGSRPAPADPRPGAIVGPTPRSHAEVLTGAFGVADVRAASSVELPCPDGDGQLSSYALTAASTAESDEWASLGFTMPRATVVSDQAPLFIHRYGSKGTVVRLGGDDVWIAATDFTC